MQVTVEVTAEDIRRGECGEPCKCPIALAVQRLLKRKYQWVMFCTGAIIRDIKTGDDCTSEIEMPDIASDFVVAFDDTEDEGIDVSPFSFPLDIPDMFLRQPTGAA